MSPPPEVKPQLVVGNGKIPKQSYKRKNRLFVAES